MRRIAVINQKGGVGKTTTAVNLGAALARLGQRVLICDLDPQCNLTVHVDVDPSAGQPSLYELLRGEATLEQVVRPTQDEKLWVLPSSVDLAGVELELVNTVGREVLLRDAFETDERAAGQPRWDYVLVDCPPSLGLLSLNALVLCDEVLVPVQSEFFALQGLSKLTEIVDLVQRRLNPRLRVTGLLSCRHDSSTNLGRQVMDDIRAHFGDVLLRSAIRRNVKLAEAPSHGKTIFEYDAESRGAEDYLALARELLGLGVAAPAKASAGKPVPVATSAPPVAAKRVEPAQPAKLVAARPAAAPSGTSARTSARKVAVAEAAPQAKAPPPAPKASAPTPARPAVPMTPRAMAEAKRIAAQPATAPAAESKPPPAPKLAATKPPAPPAAKPAPAAQPAVVAPPSPRTKPATVAKAAPVAKPAVAVEPAVAAKPAPVAKPATVAKPAPVTPPAPAAQPAATAKPVASPAAARAAPATAPSATNGHAAAAERPAPAPRVPAVAPATPAADPVPPAARRPARRAARPSTDTASQDP
jgi:chromosome partitioning protein